jgi:hypothetical protein
MSSKKLGRPELPKRNQLTVTLSAELRQRLEAAAAHQGLTVSEYVRLRVFGDTDSRPDNPILDANIDPFQLPPAKTLADLERNINTRARQFAEWVRDYTDDFGKLQEYRRKKRTDQPTTLAEELLHGKTDN